MPLRFQKNLVVVLPVNGNQRTADLPQCRYRSGSLIDPCYAPTVRQNFSGQGNPILFIGDPQVVQYLPSSIRQIRKQSSDDSPVAAGPDKILGDTLSKYRIDPVNENGFPGAGFTGKHIQLGIKRNGGTGDHCQILNIQLLEHPITPKS